MSRYYYTTKGKRQGPVTLDELKLLAAREELRRSDLLWTEGMTAWQRAGLTPAIFEGLPPDIEMAEQTRTPPPLPGDEHSGGTKAPAKSISPAMVVGLIVLVIIAIMVIINQTQKATRDQDFDRVMGAAQDASQSQSGEDPRNITPP